MPVKISRKIKDDLLSLVYPRRCPICDEPVRPYGAMVCSDCSDKVRYVTGAVCCKCGKPLEDESSEYCGDCAKRKHVYDRGMALFEYRSVADSIYRFKYRGRREYAAWYGEMIALRLGRSIKGVHPDALIPVPVHVSKMRSRGYNQASLIAHEISEHLGIPVYDDLICRVVKTAPLKDMTPVERNNILRGSFKLARNDVELKTIMIVDDIYTTGATIDAVSGVFAQAGVRNIYYTALAIGKGV